MNEWDAGLLTDGLVWVSLLTGAGCITGSVCGLWRDRRMRHRIQALRGIHEGGPTTGHRPAAQGRSALTGALEERRKRLEQWVVRRPIREGAAALGAGAFAVTLIGGITGWMIAGVAAAGVWRWMRDRQARSGSTGQQSAIRAAAEQLPLAAELMAACLAAGSSPAQAADAVGRSLGGPLGMRLIRAATELRLGAEPASVWGRFKSLPGAGGFAQCMERAGTTGVPAVEPVARLVSELRAQQGRAASARARRAAVLVTGPLGLCFLPAFLAVGVAPVVMGLARSLL